MTGLLYATLLWGLSWMPFRHLQQAGMEAVFTCLSMYLVALALLVLFRPRVVAEALRQPGWMLALALAAGWSNLGYMIGIVHDEIMRATLLFYLSPLWAVLFSRLLLGERLSREGQGVVLCALAGMVLILWKPGGGWPLPRSGADWAALTGGASFALTGVLSHRMASTGIAVRSFSICAGMVAVGAVAALATPVPFPVAADFWRQQGLLVLTLGVLALATNLSIQYGFMHVAPSRAILLFTLELVVTGSSAALYAHEWMTPVEWLGSALIIGASWLSGRMAAPNAC